MPRSRTTLAGRGDAPPQSARFYVLFLGAAVTVGCGAGNDTVTATGSGSASSGGVGGTAGGTVSGGGMATGSAATGGTTTSGTTTGGTATASGGTSMTGGLGGTTSTSSGGNRTGGTTSTGGARTGGLGGTTSTSSGGNRTGGTSSTGGARTGGTTSTGGAATGGASGSNTLCDAGVWTGVSPSVLTLSGNTFAHDPTMIEDHGVFYRYWTGNNIPSARSTNLTNWQDAPTVYSSGYPSWVDTWLAGITGQTFNFPWAPDVSRFHGLVHIYSTYSAIFGDNISCISHLTTQNPATGPWTDHGPVICTQGSERYNAIDADAGLDFAGNPYLAFGSFWDGIHIFPLNANGSRSGTTLTRIAWASQIEAPVLFRRCGFYYLFVSWGLCCPGAGRSVDQLTYRVVVGRATNILGPYVDRSGTPMVNGGGTLVVQGDGVTWAAAGHSDVLVSGNRIYHLYHAYRKSNGDAQLRLAELVFDSDGWPVPHAP